MPDTPAATDTPRTEAAADLRLPWHRETIGHRSTAGIVRQVAADLDVPLAEGLPPNTDATWIISADNRVVAFVGNGPRQTHNADAIIRAVEAAATPQVQADPPLSDRGLLEQSCIAVVGPWFDKSHESGSFRPMELAQAILNEYDRRSQVQADPPAEGLRRAADRLANTAEMMLHWTSHPDDESYRSWLPAARGDMQRELAEYRRLAATPAAKPETTDE